MRQFPIRTSPTAPRVGLKQKVLGVLVYFYHQRAALFACCTKHLTVFTTSMTVPPLLSCVKQDDYPVDTWGALSFSHANVFDADQIPPHEVRSFAVELQDQVLRRCEEEKDLDWGISSLFSS